MAAIGTTLAQWDALRTIKSNAGASGHTLATLTFQTDQSLGALINKLVHQRLINRHAGVGRSLFYTLTDQGRQMLKDGSKVVEDVLEVSFRSLSPPERENLFALLGKVLSDDGPSRSIKSRARDTGVDGA